jgi:hypothetical protein
MSFFIPFFYQRLFQKTFWKNIFRVNFAPVHLRYNGTVHGKKQKKSTLTSFNFEA